MKVPLANAETSLVGAEIFQADSTSAFSARATSWIAHKHTMQATTGILIRDSLLIELAGDAISPNSFLHNTGLHVVRRRLQFEFRFAFVLPQRNGYKPAIQSSTKPRRATLIGDDSTWPVFCNRGGLGDMATGETGDGDF